MTMVPFKTKFPYCMTYKIFCTSLVLFIVCVTQSIYSPELIYGASLVLQWQSNEEDDLAGYTIYCASSQPDHDLIVDLGNVTECELTNLALYENVAYGIALTAYDSSGNESDFSDPLYVTLDDEIDDGEDNCPDIYNPNQEDMYPPGGNDIGDVCETTLTTSSTTIPTLPPVSTTTIPHASTTTTITECEKDSDCADDGLYCNGDEFCDEGTCVSADNPCEAELICDETTDECRPVVPPVTLQLTPDIWYQSRWVPLIKFLRIEGSNSHFDKSDTEITFTPDSAVIMLPLVIDEATINCCGILMPRLWAPFDAIDVKVSTGEEEATATMEIQLLPFMPEREKNLLLEE